MASAFYNHVLAFGASTLSGKTNNSKQSAHSFVCVGISFLFVFFLFGCQTNVAPSSGYPVYLPSNAPNQSAPPVFPVISATETVSRINSTYTRNIIQWNEVPSPDDMLGQIKVRLAVRVVSEQNTQRFSFDYKNLSAGGGDIVEALVDLGVSALAEAYRASIDHKYQFCLVEGSDYPIVLDTRKLAAPLTTGSYYMVTAKHKSVFRVYNANQTLNCFLTFEVSIAEEYTPTTSPIESDKTIQMSFGDVRVKGAAFSNVKSKDYLFVYYEYSNTTSSAQSLRPDEILPSSSDIALNSYHGGFLVFIPENGLDSYFDIPSFFYPFYMGLAVQPGQTETIGVVYGIDKPKAKKGVTLSYRNLDQAFNVVDSIDVPVFSSYRELEEVIGGAS